MRVRSETRPVPNGTIWNAKPVFEYTISVSVVQSDIKVLQNIVKDLLNSYLELKGSYNTHCTPVCDT